MSVLQKTITLDLAESFKKIVGEAYFFTDEATLQDYSKDATETLQFSPQAVLKPATADEISAILKICNQYKIPVTPRGGGTGLSGGALPYLGGIVISTERLNKILHIDERNLQVTTEPGVITEVLQREVAARGLFYPPDPSSKGSCFIGGNIAENSGGPRAVKYGVVKDYVLNLEVVLPTGEIIWTGANVLKNVTGYNLTQLIIGSEGTLGIVTKIVLKLIPLPKYDILMLAPFNDLDKACEAVSAIFRAGCTPSALELMEIDALTIVSQMVGTHAAPVNSSIAAHLLIELDGNNKDVLVGEMEQIAALMEQHGAGDLLLAEDAQQKEELWKLRRRMAEYVKMCGYTIEEDVVVPRAELSRLIKVLKEMGHKHQFKSVAYGHAGDGNLHIRIKKDSVADSYKNPEMQLILRELFQQIKALGGTITGEHGVGLIQKGFMDIMFEERTLQIMRDIKRAFDPNNILNPGKIFD